MIDKRLTIRLTEYWNKLRGDASLPQWESFDKDEFTDVWKQMCGWALDAGEANSVVFTYDHFGESVKHAVGNDLSGKKFITSSRVLPGAPLTHNIVGANLAEQMYVSDFSGFEAAKIIKKIDRAINKHCPLIDEGRFENTNGRTVRYRSCLMPFGSAGGKVEHILLGLSWKVY